VNEARRAAPPNEAARAASVSDAISIGCRPTPSGFACDVVVGSDADATRHRVNVGREDLADLAPGHDDPERLVVASFEFLLAREPRESILRTFDLTVIERYFPGYGTEIRGRMTRA
jgi:hypothetical protein